LPAGLLPSRRRNAAKPANLKPSMDIVPAASSTPVAWENMALKATDVEFPPKGEC
jgi:hypothetical protein